MVHGHDKAGIQATDCYGDWHYFEHFDDDGNTQQRGCDDYAKYPAQDNVCYFHHPGLNKNYGDYQCGWWRGYNNANDAMLFNSWNEVGVDAVGATPQKASAMYALRKCDNCDGNDASQHTWRNVQPSPVA